MEKHNDNNVIAENVKTIHISVANNDDMWIEIQALLNVPEVDATFRITLYSNLKDICFISNTVGETDDVNKGREIFSN